MHAEFLEPDVGFDVELQDAMNVIARSSFWIEAAVDLVVLKGVPESVKLLLVLVFQATSGIEEICEKQRWPWTGPRQSSLTNVMAR